MNRYYTPKRTEEFNPFKVYFSSRDKEHTLTRPVLKSKKWKRIDESITERINSSRFGVVTVYDNGDSFFKKEMYSRLKKSLSNEGVSSRGFSSEYSTHCDFCGQSIQYVAIVVSFPLDGSNKTKFHQIGCDCLALVFGTSWFGYRNASEIRKQLVNKNKQKKRQKEYRKKYKGYIEWLKKVSDYTDVISGYHQTFFRDMLDILVNGSKPFSKNMERYLRSMQRQKPFRTFVELDEYRMQFKSIEKQFTTLLELIIEVDGRENIHKRWSSYSFISNVYEQNIKRFRLPTNSQMEWVTKTYRRYSSKTQPNDGGVKLTKNEISKSVSNVPW